MRKFRPIAIRSLVPAFDEHYFPGKDVGTDAATGGGEQKRMKRKLRQEKRGAVRELRKDATFLALERRQLSQRSGMLIIKFYNFTCCFGSYSNVLYSTHFILFQFWRKTLSARRMHVG